MKHWVSFRDVSPEQLAALVAFARALKQRSGEATVRAKAAIQGKILGLVFFNPSLRTRVSFETAMLRHGGSAISLNVGGDAWNLEHRDHQVMNGDRAEHIREAAPVLSRYCDALGVRTFAGLKNADEDAEDALIHAFARHATVPVVNLESAMEHPCQALADWMTIDERFGSTSGRPITITWAPQAKGVPMAVPNSAVLFATAAGMQVTLAHPPGYELHPAILDRARGWAAQTGGALRVTHDQPTACADADVVYVKSWASPRLYGDDAAQQENFRRYADWMVTPAHLPRAGSILMHCLPVRRNVVISDSALDDPRCAVVDQAENRHWAQSAILTELFQG